MGRKGLTIQTYSDDKLCRFMRLRCQGNSKKVGNAANKTCILDWYLHDDEKDNTNVLVTDVERIKIPVERSFALTEAFHKFLGDKGKKNLGQPGVRTGASTVPSDKAGVDFSKMICWSKDGQQEDPIKCVGVDPTNNDGIFLRWSGRGTNQPFYGAFCAESEGKSPNLTLQSKDVSFSAMTRAETRLRCEYYR